ncbi:FhaA domain-containing protein [Arthrobacter sp. NPDC090010]|uniref:FhaA domain-containing protein n=1 Tax=Arthrobacter sp. NPDC090010 TaxID=3363942 RepID=UPI00380D09D3
MGLLDRVERGLEKAVRSVFSGGAKAQLQPVEIASRLRREIDNKVLTVSTSRSIAPNSFDVLLGEADYARAEEWGTALAEELCDVVIQHAKSQGYTLPGPVRVAFVRESEIKPGEVQIQSRADRSQGTASGGAPRPPAPARSAPPRVQPVLDYNEQRYSLNAPSIILGRASDADIPVDDTGVSRRHLEIRTQGNASWAVDLGSTNGTYINGQKLDGSIELTDGSVITMGRARLTFRLIPATPGRDA